MYKTLLFCALLATPACSTNPVAAGAQAVEAVLLQVDWQQQNDLALPEANRLAADHVFCCPRSWIRIHIGFSSGLVAGASGV
jgi:hypothetical protein